jgi:hypothetical protein
MSDYEFYNLFKRKDSHFGTSGCARLDSLLHVDFGMLASFSLLLT